MVERAAADRKVRGSNPGLGPLENSMQSMHVLIVCSWLETTGRQGYKLDEWDHCNNMEHTHTVSGNSHSCMAESEQPDQRECGGIYYLHHEKG